MLFCFKFDWKRAEKRGRTVILAALLLFFFYERQLKLMWPAYHGYNREGEHQGCRERPSETKNSSTKL